MGAMIVMLNEGMRILWIAEEMGIKLTGTPEVLTDSQSGWDMMFSPDTTKHTVRSERWIYRVREAFLKNKMEITFVPSEKMRAGDKTKIVRKAKFEFCRKVQLNLEDDTEISQKKQRGMKDSV